MADTIEGWGRLDRALEDLRGADSQAGVLGGLLDAADGLFHVDRELGDGARLALMVREEWLVRELGEAVEWGGGEEDCPPGLSICLHKPLRGMPFEAVTIDFSIPKDEIEGLGLLLVDAELGSCTALLLDSLIARPVAELDPSEVFLAATEHLVRPASDVADAAQVLVLVTRSALDLAAERVGRDDDSMVEARAALDDAEEAMAAMTHHASRETADMRQWARDLRPGR